MSKIKTVSLRNGHSFYFRFYIYWADTPAAAAAMLLQQVSGEYRARDGFREEFYRDETDFFFVILPDQCCQRKT